MKEGDKEHREYLLDKCILDLMEDLLDYGIILECDYKYMFEDIKEAILSYINLDD